MAPLLSAHQYEQLYGHGPRPLGSHPPFPGCAERLVSVRYKHPRRFHRRAVEVQLVQQVRRAAIWANGS